MIYAEKSTLKLSKIFFKKNYAKVGGCIFESSENSKDLKKILGKSLLFFLGSLIYKTIFNSNRAFDEGGCIKWTMSQPQIYKVFFINNSAIYGPNFASFPVKINFIFLNHSTIKR